MHGNCKILNLEIICEHMIKTFKQQSEYGLNLFRSYGDFCLLSRFEKDFYSFWDYGKGKAISRGDVNDEVIMTV